MGRPRRGEKFFAPTAGQTQSFPCGKDAPTLDSGFHRNDGLCPHPFGYSSGQALTLSLRREREKIFKAISP